MTHHENAILFLVVLCCSALSVRAQSQTISYQGVLANASGGPVDSGTYSVTVTFYSDEGGQHPLWQDTYATEVRKGVFNIALGSNKPLPKATEMDGLIWVGTAINGTAETRPLARLGAVPFAMNVADNSITANKLATDFVSSISVNGQKVTGKGTPLNISTGDGLDAVFDPGSNSLLLTGGRTRANGKGATAQTQVGAVFWTETGNKNISVPTQFIGTTDTSSAFEIHLEDVTVTAPLNRIAHFEIPLVSGAPNIIMGFGAGAATGNTISTLTSGSTIAGGGKSGNVNAIDAYFSFVGSGVSNSILGDSSAIAGGTHNSIGTSATWSFIGAGSDNIIANSNPGPAGSAILSGFHNRVYDYSSFIGTGTGNVIGLNTDLDGDDSASVIVGGSANFVEEGWGFVGSGYHNYISGAHDINYSSIVGGYYNFVQGQYDGVLGGWFNHIDPEWQWTSIVGGDSNVASGHFVFMGGGYWNHARGKAIAIPGGGANLAGTSPHNPNGTDFATIGGGEKNTIDGLSSEHATIAGGEANTIDGDYGHHSFVGGGKYNRILGDTIGTRTSAYTVISGGNSNTVMQNSLASTIAGGANNTVDTGATYSSIGGGLQNTIQGPYSVIAGGENNSIYNIGADHNMIGGGLHNIEQNPSFGVIAGGWNNLLDTAAWGSTIGGGDSNIVQPPLSFIGGGRMNKIDDIGWADGGAIVGGYHNRMVHGVYSFIGAGESNFLQDEHSTLVGGYADTMYGYGEFLGGGIKNTIYWGSDTATLVGGASNYVGGGKFSFLGGGLKNTISAPFGVLVGGDSNYAGGGLYNSLVGGLQDTIALSSSSTLGGGDSNIIHQNIGSTLTGGEHNVISTPYCDSGCLPAQDNFLGGGAWNYIVGHAGWNSLVGGTRNYIAGVLYGTIGGGAFNSTYSNYTVISGGTSNLIEATGSAVGGGTNNIILGSYGTISGGAYDSVNGQYGSIGGGNSNVIRLKGANASIPGGDHLVAQSYGQTFVGFYNKAQGSSTDTSDALIPAHENDILLGVGNGRNIGGVTVASDAAFITNKGALSVFDSIGSGGATAGGPITPSRAGTTFATNTIEAWGNVAPLAPGGTLLGGGALADVGVQSVFHGPPGSGSYLVTLNVKNQDGSAHTFTTNQASITVSLGPGPGAGGGMITVTPLTGGTAPTFTVVTFLPALGGASDAYGFQFHVVAR